MSAKNVSSIMEPETLENLVQVVNRLAQFNQTMEDLVDLTKFMVPSYMEIGEDIAALATKVGQKLYTEDNLELAGRLQTVAPTFARLADTVLKMAEDGTIEKVRVLMEAAGEALGDVDIDNPRKFSLFEAAKDLNDKEVQKTLGMVLDIARKLPSAVERHRA